MDLGLSGKRVLITGASKGIGRAIAEVLAEEGCSLHLASRTEADLARARDEINEKHGVQVTIHPLDLSDGENAKRLAQGDRRYRYPRKQRRCYPGRRHRDGYGGNLA